IELLAGFFFLIIALALVGPGQELGRAFQRASNRVRAYTLNLLGSVAGIVLFALFSWWPLSPLWWFLPVALGLGYFLCPHVGVAPSRVGMALLGGMLLAMLGLASFHPGLLPGRDQAVEQMWSPYYRIDYIPSQYHITVNLIGHQQMVA